MACVYMCLFVCLSMSVVRTWVKEAKQRVMFCLAQKGIFEISANVSLEMVHTKQSHTCRTHCFAQPGTLFWYKVADCGYNQDFFPSFIFQVFYVKWCESLIAASDERTDIVKWVFRSTFDCLIVYFKLKLIWPCGDVFCCVVKHLIVSIFIIFIKKDRR